MLKIIKALTSKQETAELISNINTVSLDIAGVNWNDLNELDDIYHKVTGLLVRDTTTNYSGFEMFPFLASFTSETQSKYSFPRMENLKHLHLAWHKSYSSSFKSAFDNLEELFIRYFSEKDLKIVSNLKNWKSWGYIKTMYFIILNG